MMNGMKYNSRTKWPEDKNDLGWKKPCGVFGVKERTKAQEELRKVVAEVRREFETTKFIRKIADGWTVAYGVVDVNKIEGPTGLIFNIKPKYTGFKL